MWLKRWQRGANVGRCHSMPPFARCFPIWQSWVSPKSNPRTLPNSPNVAGSTIVILVAPLPATSWRQSRLVLWPKRAFRRLTATTSNARCGRRSPWFPPGWANSPVQNGSMCPYLLRGPTWWRCFVATPMLDWLPDGAPTWWGTAFND